VKIRRFLSEMAALVACAALCATVSNWLAGRERKLAPVGRYPNALTVPGSVPAAPPLGGVPSSATAPEAAPVAATAPAPVSPEHLSVVAEPRPAPMARPSVRPPSPAKGALPLPPASGSDLLKKFPSHPGQVSVEISGDDAAWAFRNGVPFLDARRTKAYEEGHVAGARSFPVWESDVDQRILSLVGEGRPTELPTVIYCSGGECEDSHMLAERLFGAGFVNLLVYRDGWPDWQRRQGASRTGAVP